MAKDNEWNSLNSASEQEPFGSGALHCERKKSVSTWKNGRLKKKKYVLARDGFLDIEEVVNIPGFPGTETLNNKKCVVIECKTEHPM